ncbi:MAG TPA: hypothetical protein VGM88_26010 [Kofleriaceae bacterium]|jgi:hypothetical protein
MSITKDWAPAPTVFNGGPDRQKAIWEELRGINEGGYGSGRIAPIPSMNCAHGKPYVTSCSPFTAQAIGMMMDLRPGAQTSYQPTYDGGKTVMNGDLATSFYSMHNGFYFKVDYDVDPKDAAKTARAKAAAEKRAADREKLWRDAKFSPTSSELTNNSAASCFFYNYGYEIDPRDMRRGDLAGIGWSDGGGHAVFIWDVHTDKSGAVDCFTFLSSNGTGAGGWGVSVWASQLGKLMNWPAKNDVSVKSGIKIFEDRDDYVRYGYWQCIPGKFEKDIDQTTFKVPLQNKLVDMNSPRPIYPLGVRGLRVCRFWGFPPPDSPHGNLATPNLDQANQLKKWALVEPQCMGTSTPAKGIVVPQLPPVAVPKSHPDPIKAVPPKPAPPQKKEEAVPHQHWVEDALHELYVHKWITVDPELNGQISDAATKRAVTDFQTKLKVAPIDGICGQLTRPRLEQALKDLRAGKPNPNGPPPKPSLERFYWFSNHVAVGGTNGLALVTETFDLFDSFELTLTDQHGKSAKVPLGMASFAGRGITVVTIPKDFAAGSKLSARVRGTAKGQLVDKTTQVALEVGSPPPPASDDWPWDETKWTPYMRGVVAELRAAPKGPGTFTQREITQYGVKERMEPGDVQIMGKAGPLSLFPPVTKLSLYRADIEGTMRWQGRILNIVASGNVYDKVVQTNLGGKTVTKRKPTLEKFDPAKSLWIDVTDRDPWGSAARMPLIPFRVLAHNSRGETPLFGRIVYIQQLDGFKLPTGEVHNGMCVVGDVGGMTPGEQFDFFVGRMDAPLQIPSIAKSGGGSICHIEILGASAAYSKPQR